MSAPVLEVRNVGYAVGGVPLLADVSVDVAPGTLHAILGPNGAGKSTLMRICVGELPASTSEVRLNERALTQIDPADQARMRSYAGSVEHIPFPYTGCAEGCTDQHTDEHPRHSDRSENRGFSLQLGWKFGGREARSYDASYGSETEGKVTKSEGDHRDYHRHPEEKR